MKHVLYLLIIFSFCFPLTVDDILDKSEANDNFKTSISSNVEEVYNSDGTVKVSEMKVYSKNGNDKTIMEYTEPKRIKGMKILMLNKGDDIWFYSNRTNRVRKIASHQKNQSANNSDFSYDDMSMSDNRKDYIYSITGEENHNGSGCYRIEFKAKDKTVTYSRFVIWIDRSNYLALGGEFFDEDGKLWKKLDVRDIKKIGKYWTAGEIEMKNVQKDSRTVIKTKEISFDTDLPDDMFTERGLRK